MTSAATHQQTAGVPPFRRWSQAELLLACVLLVLAAVAWLVTGSLADPHMRSGVLTGAQPMHETMAPAPVEVALFLGTWAVMMAAMMLPSIAPFTVGVSRLMRTQSAGRGSTAALTAGYLLVWATSGVAAYVALRGLGSLAMGPTESAVRVGGVVLLAAGLYQLTPLKRVCLRHCRSPLMLLMHYGPKAVRSRRGALRVGLAHGAYCFGCCWALIAVLLAAGAMSLVWMGVIAAVVAVEKVNRHGEAISRVLGGVLVLLALILLVEPGIVGSSY